MSKTSESLQPILLRIRPSLPDPDEASANRGPIMMETALSTLHSLHGTDGEVSLKIGMADGKISLFTAASPRAASLIESQIYGQYPDAEIDPIDGSVFALKEGEIVAYTDLYLKEPEVFPIKRYPQFSDLSTRQNVDTIAGITAALVRYPKPGMRGHISLTMTPVGEKYRKRALKFIPFLEKGIPKYWPAYARLFTTAHLASGWKRLTLFPLDMLMGGWRVWFSPFKAKTSVSLLTGDVTENEGRHDEAAVSMRSHEREDSVSAAVDKVNRLLWTCSIRISVVAPAACKQEAIAKIHEIAGSFLQFTLPSSNGFDATPVIVSTKDNEGRSPRYALSAEEIATLWHIPNIMVKTPNMDWVISKKLEPPVNLPVPGVTDPEGNLTVLGESVFHGQRMQFGIRPDDRRRHIYVIGKTGMGKSTLLENMIFSDILSGKGIGVIDPHGDLIEAILRFIPKSRSNDVVLFDPADRDYPISFNMLECANPDQRSLICSGLMSVFTKLWPEAFSGRMEHILRNTLLALLENEGSSMLGILRMFGDDAFCKKIVSNVSDPVVKSFWETEYAGWSDKYRTEAVAAIQNKIGQLLTTPLIRNIVGQVKSTLDIRHAMDTGKIVLVNLSKGKLGEDTAAFLGSMLVTKFQIDAMSRADIPEKDRRDFYLYVDEFQNFATKSFATILSEARKYRLALTMAHQYVGQLTIGQNDSSLRDAVFGNVGSMVSFQVGSDDAEDLSLQFEEMLTSNDILSLPKYHAYIRLMIDGVSSKPFSVSTLAPPKFEQDEKRVQIIRELSRERYAQKRADVEEKIMRWAASVSEGKTTAKTAEKAKEKEEEEMKKARAKKMTLEQYRQWRDREMWMNEYNALKKREMLGETLNESEKSQMEELAKKLEATGGVPAPSKSMLDAVEKAKKKLAS
jgi:hypothetical protein